MKSKPDLKVVFHIEPADRSVGIMAEGFSAWDENGDQWCDLKEMGQDGFLSYRFQWFDNHTGNECPPSKDAKLIELLLYQFVEHYYRNS